VEVVGTGAKVVVVASVGAGACVVVVTGGTSVVVVGTVVSGEVVVVEGDGSVVVWSLYVTWIVIALGSDLCDGTLMGPPGKSTLIPKRPPLVSDSNT